MRNDYEVRGDVTAIFLRTRKGAPVEALIDTDDLPTLLQFDVRWRRLQMTAYRCYAVCNPRDMLNLPRTMRMHRFILPHASNRLDIDHINHNGLDNRRSNLRVVSRSVNMLNRNGNDSDNTTGYRGVYWDNAARSFVAEILVGGRRFRTSGYLTVHEAAYAVRAVLESVDPLAARNYPHIDVPTIECAGNSGCANDGKSRSEIYSSLTLEQVREIRQLSQRLRVPEIAAYLNMSRTTVRNIVTGQRWAGVE